MAYRVIQWATGNVGRAAVEGIVWHPDLELVGTWVHSPDKAGRDVGELCGIGPIGVLATGDEDRLLALDADCVLYSPLLPDTAQVIRILESGKNVVTPLGWFYPFASMDVAAIEAACQRGGATLHGTGIHPGGITERFPLMLSALSSRIRHVRAEEFSDIRAYRAEFVVREIMLFGKDPETARTSPMLDLLGNGFGQSIDMVAAGLGIPLDPQKVAVHELASRPQPSTPQPSRSRPGPSPRSASHGTAPSAASPSSRRGSTGSWANATSIRRGPSDPKASASRSRSRASPRFASRSMGCIRPIPRSTSSAIRDSSPPRCTA